MSVQNSNSGSKANNSASPLTEAPLTGGGIKGWWQRVCQQRLMGSTPRHSIFTVLSYYMAVTCFLLALGGLQYAYKTKVVQKHIRYDDSVPGGTCDGRSQELFSAAGNGVTSTLAFNVTETMTAPVHVFFKIKAFVSGHKRFQRSRDDEQNAGVDWSMVNPLSQCQPQAFLGSDSNVKNENLTNDGAITPCGLIGWSQFNDSFALQDSTSGSGVPIAQEDIAWKQDIDWLFGDVPAVNYNIETDLRGGNTTVATLKESEHLIVWFRVSSKPDLTYRWGTIEQDLHPGEYSLTILNRYNTYSLGFCAEKSFVLSTNTWDGGGNMFLPIVYLAAGGLFGLTLLFFTVAFFFFPRRALGDMATLSWNRIETGYMKDPYAL